jgi:vacuolar-type H+-ATPase subunit I/STV1
VLSPLPQEISGECSALAEQLRVLQEQRTQEAAAWTESLQRAEAERDSLQTRLEEVQQQATLAAIAEQQRQSLEQRAVQQQEQVCADPLLLTVLQCPLVTVVSAVLPIITSQEAKEVEAYSLQIADLKAALESKAEREAQLLAEMRKKSEAARQLLVAKDAELEAVRVKLKAVGAAVPVPVTPSRPPAAASAITPASSNLRQGSSVADAAEGSAAVAQALFRAPAEHSVFTADEVR